MKQTAKKRGTTLTVNDLIADDTNANDGTLRGQDLVCKSLQRFGTGRSILVDKNNRIIAGNKTTVHKQERSK
jgi:hypothetical protein